MKKLFISFTFLMLTTFLGASRQLEPTNTFPPAEFEQISHTTFASVSLNGGFSSSVTPTPTPGPSNQSDQIGSTDIKNPSIIGPDTFPSDVNPLTGLQEDKMDLLKLPPAFVSIANFPTTARPQAGLSFSPLVFEMYIGEGMTRFLAAFYGKFPDTSGSNSSQNNLTTLDNSQIGPIRSGRLPYESVRKLYSGFLVMASAYRAVASQLSSTTNIFGSDADNINSALIDVSKLEAIAQATAKTKYSMNLTGNQFSTKIPENGEDAVQLWIFYNYLNQVEWKYVPASGSYLRSQDNADGKGNFIPSTDRLTGKQLAFENVILLFAQHKVLNSERTLIDIDLLYTGNKAYLFRDGQVFPIYWNTMNGEYEKKTGLLRPIRFTDRDGKPISLKPGSTFVEIVDTTATLQEISTGSWKARFYAP